MASVLEVEISTDDRTKLLRLVESQDYQALVRYLELLLFKLRKDNDNMDLRERETFKIRGDIKRVKKLLQLRAELQGRLQPQK